ncbi:putative C56F8.12-like protein [Cladobotryum mycophilum]|uniref:C56F8.12-like protein n=1 Tax=Cladobotryum mycophilum TaxID=491253 RepID=A0ABR0SLT3_9HYPO
MVRHEIFDARDILSFPTGDNSTDTVFGGVHFNLTTLEHWNYTYYEGNGTLSNGTKCWLTYEPYEPVLLLNNGTFVNATKCYSSVDPIGSRGYTGIGFAAAYGLGLVFTITVLAKHGKLYLPKEKRFFPIGRRWQWYWALFVCACALISLFTNVDVDRYHVQELPIVLTSFFWFLICQGTMGMVWEAVRHWGSWQERQFIDPNPFIYRNDDRRSMVEFWLPLWFYLWVWMNFFLVVPRSWKFAEQQRSPEQTAAKAIPGATGPRFKAAAFCLVVAWLTILVSLWHSIKHYKHRERGVFNTVRGVVQAVPFRFVLTIPLSLVLIAYQAYISFNWDYSVMRADGVVPAIYIWGYGPSLLIIYIQAIYGWTSPNEDKALIQQRRHRGDVLDRELGLVKKPTWWRRVRGDHLQSLRDKITNNVNEIGGKRGVGRRVEDDMERAARLDAERFADRNDGYELSPLPRKDSSNPRMDRAGVRNMEFTPAPPPLRYAGRSEQRHNERIVETFAGVLFPNNADSERARRLAEITQDGPPPPYTDEEQGSSARPGSARRNNSTSTSNSINAPPQKVRSMLDV